MIFRVLRLRIEDLRLEQLTGEVSKSAIYNLKS